MAHKQVFTPAALFLLVALLLGETAINYIDRQIISVLATTLRGRRLNVTYSYTAVFIGLSLLIPVAMIVGFQLMGRCEPVRELQR